MREHWWVNIGGALVLSLAAPVPGQARPGGSVALTGVADSQEPPSAGRCEDLDFVGCVDVDLDDEEGDYLRIGTCNGRLADRTAREYYERLDDACRDRCRSALEALEAAQAARNDAIPVALGALEVADENWESGSVIRPGPGELDALARLLEAREFEQQAQAAVRRLREAQQAATRAQAAYKACACKCAPAAGGLSTRTKVGGAVGAVVLGIGGATVFGGGGTPASSNPPGTPPGMPPPSNPGPNDPSGIYILVWVVLEDGQLSAQFVRLQEIREIRVTVNGTAVTLTAQSPFAPLSLSGNWNPSNGEITASGAGPLAGRPNVGVTLSGILNQAGLRARVVVGADGSLGGRQPHTVVYEANGTRPQ
jgi:hypothetical protein